MSGSYYTGQAKMSFSYEKSLLLPIPKMCLLVTGLRNQLYPIRLFSEVKEKTEN